MEDGVSRPKVPRQRGSELIDIVVKLGFGLVAVSGVDTA
jgi:hypothetical protein